MNHKDKDTARQSSDGPPPGKFSDQGLQGSRRDQPGSGTGVPGVSGGGAGGGLEGQGGVQQEEPDPGSGNPELDPEPKPGGLGARRRGHLTPRQQGVVGDLPPGSNVVGPGYPGFPLVATQREGSGPGVSAAPWGDFCRAPWEAGAIIQMVESTAKTGERRQTACGRQSTVTP